MFKDILADTMLKALSKSVLPFLIAPILVELRPTNKKVGQNMLNRGEVRKDYIAK